MTDSSSRDPEETLEQNCDMFQAMVRGGMDPQRAFDLFRKFLGENQAKAVIERLRPKVAYVKRITTDSSDDGQEQPR